MVCSLKIAIISYPLSFGAPAAGVPFWSSWWSELLRVMGLSSSNQHAFWAVLEIRDGGFSGPDNPALETQKKTYTNWTLVDGGKAVCTGSFGMVAVNGHDDKLLNDDDEPT